MNSSDKAGYIRFWVKDNGEGIEPEKISTLFKEFTRLHSAGEGHGLGLSIVKSIVDKFRGSVGVESDVGNGSLFYFTLPTTPTMNN
jgi:signal transduction histidine kinase